MAPARYRCSISLADQRLRLCQIRAVAAETSAAYGSARRDAGGKEDPPPLAWRSLPIGKTCAKRRDAVTGICGLTSRDAVAHVIIAAQPAHHHRTMQRLNG